jgi:CHAD domain-containing protein
MTTQDQPHLVSVRIDTVPAHPREADVTIGIDESLGDALVRITLDQFDIMIPALLHPDDIDRGIHEARKAMKRTRALLRLVRDELGYDVYRNENVVLRDVSRNLAPVRDSDVLLRTLAAVKEIFGPSVSSHAFTSTRSYLRLEHRRLRTTVVDDRQLMTDLATTLNAARGRFSGRGGLGSQNAGPPIRDDFRAIRGGLRRVHRRGRRGFEQSMRAPEPEILHEWRKRVKYLQYQVESLSPLWPDLLDAYGDRLSTLAETLGTEHDFAVLRAVILDAPDACPDPRERSTLVALIDHHTPRLRHEAFTLGATIYDERTKAFVERMESYWHASRSTPAAPGLGGS